jgi:CobQ/CobB/MinD/ParA nucleotide binding domain
MTKPIYIAGGSKGGVGKSFVSIGLLDTLRERGEDVLLIESDTSNPDVWKMYHGEIQSELIDLDDADGWIDLVNLCEQHPKHCVVINTAARNNRGVAFYGQTLNNTVDELKRKLVTFWVINRQRDSLELLRDYMKTLSASTVHVVRNSYFGDEKKFELYNNSETRQLVEAARGLSLTFPDLADRVSDDLYSKRLSMTTALNQLPMGNRAELRRWQGDVHAVLGSALDA